MNKFNLKDKVTILEPFADGALHEIIEIKPVKENGEFCESDEDVAVTYCYILDNLLAYDEKFLTNG